MDVIQCQQCGGIVVYDAGREHARCLFCAGVALEPASLDAPLTQPESAIAFSFDPADADAAYRDWARSSWWYPRELRDLSVGLEQMWIPAWRIDADVETHWAGLESASTRSGKRPISGTDVARARALVPASSGLSEPELTRLAPFDDGDVVLWRKDGHAHPFEPAAMSLAAATGRATKQYAEIRRRAISRRQHVSSCRVSVALTDVDHRLLMLPIYIGSMRYRDRPWRFVINGSAGRVVGDAPVDRRKVALVAALVVFVALVAWWFASRGG